MKKLLLLILISQLGIFAKAQYKPLLQTNSEWYVNEYFEGYENRHFKIIGDSIINNLAYKVLREENTMSIYGLFREDTMLRKVFWLLDNVEEVYYDFSLEPGQSFTFSGSIGSLDSISNQLYYVLDHYLMDTLYLNLKSFKVFYFKGNMVWIEGIGSLCGIMSNVFAWNSPSGVGNYLTCHYNTNGVRDFQYLFKYRSSECVGPTFINETSEYETYKPFPNPTTNGTFSIPVNDIQRIQVFNLYGTLVKVIPVVNGNQSFNISELPNGMYVLRMRVGKNAVVTQRLIKI